MEKMSENDVSLNKALKFMGDIYTEQSVLISLSSHLISFYDNLDEETRKKLIPFVIFIPNYKPETALVHHSCLNKFLEDMNEIGSIVLDPLTVIRRFTN